MAQIKWTPQALDDIEAIADFIAMDSSYYARMFTIKVFEAADRLELFPESGRIVPELNRKEIKEIIVTLQLRVENFQKISTNPSFPTRSRWLSQEGRYSSLWQRPTVGAFKQRLGGIFYEPVTRN